MPEEETLEEKRYELEKFKAEREAKSQSDRLELDREKADQDRIKAEQDAKLERRRLALDRAKAAQERRFLRNPTALIALISAIVSAAGVGATYIMENTKTKLASMEKQQELDLAKIQNDRQYCLQSAQVTAGFLSTNGTSKDLVVWGRQLISSACPQFAQANAPASAQGKGTATTSEPLQLEMVEGNNQVIPRSGWKNFLVRVTKNKVPVAGVKVAWRTDDLAYTYIGATDQKGVSSATNLYTFSDPGQHTQTAQLLEGNPPVGFTDWSNIKSQAAGKTVEFQFAFQ